MRVFLVFLWSIMVSNCFAIGDKDFGSARHFGLGGASTTLIGGFSSLDNQGTLGLVDSATVSLSYRNNFFMHELGTSSLGLILPIKSGVLGMSLTRFGSKYYNQNNLGLAYGKKLHDRISFGVRLNYQRVQQFEYGSAGIVTAEVGFVSKVSDNLSLAGHVYNPFRAKFKTESNSEFRSESGLRLGVNYQLDDLSVLLEVESGTIASFLVKTALEYHPIDILFVRAGFVYPQSQLSGGIGLDLKKFKTDVYYQHHILLGSSSGISLTYAF